jgi:hypothetical protein
MRRRVGALILSFFVLNATGCALLDLAALPFKLLFSILGGAAGVVGLGDVDPAKGPPPIVRRVDDGRWLVADLREDAPCTIVCSAPDCEPRAFAWPADFRGSDGNLVVRLERSK